METENHKITQSLFTVQGKPLVIPPRYRELFDIIFTRNKRRTNVIAPTQDGKSLTVASAVVLVASALPEKFTILAPSEKKADIIMSYIRDFATQNPIIYKQLELDPDELLDRLKRERSKRNLTFKRGGGVQTLTLDAKNGKRSIEAVMGFGSKNIILDESSLIDDPLFSTVMRMLGGYDYDDTFLLEIGNPFYNNHFKRNSESERYHKIHKTYLDSMRDKKNGYHGYDERFIEEMRDEAFFDVFYECKFPKEDEIDSNGYRQLVNSDDLHNDDRELKELLIIKDSDSEEEKKKKLHYRSIAKLGADIGGGGDYNCYEIRIPEIGSFLEAKNKSIDTMVNVTEIERIVELYGLRWENVNIDDIGIGRGVADRLKEKGHNVNGVAVGETSSDTLKYANLKAELSWHARNEIKNPEFVINDSETRKQALWIKYKTNSDKQLKIEPKADLKKRSGKSPDHWDALVLTYYEAPFVGFV